MKTKLSTIGKHTLQTDGLGRYVIFKLGQKVGQLDLTDVDAAKLAYKAAEHRGAQLEEAGC